VTGRRTNGRTDRHTDGRNYDSQYRASIARAVKMTLTLTPIPLRTPRVPAPWEFRALGSCLLCLYVSLPLLLCRQRIIYTIIKSTSVGDARLSVVGVAGWPVILTGWQAGRRPSAWSKWAWSTHAMVSASQEQTLSGTGARVYTGPLDVVTGISARPRPVKCNWRIRDQHESDI